MKLNYDDIEEENKKIAELISKHSEEFQTDKEIPNLELDPKRKIYKIPTVAAACVVLCIVLFGAAINNMSLGRSESSRSTQMSADNSFDKENSVDYLAEQEEIADEDDFDSIYENLVSSSNIVFGDAYKDWKIESKVEMSADTATCSGPNYEKNDFSGTNNQTEGVEEGDIVKTDGKYIYVLDEYKKKVFIASADKGNVDRVSEIEFENDNICYNEMYVDDDILILVGVQNMEEDTCTFIGSNTIITVFNIKERTKPELVSKHTQDGHYISSRIYDGFLYTVSYNEYSLFDKEYCIPKVDEIYCGKKDIVIPQNIEDNYYTVVTSIKIKDSENIVDKTAIYGCGNEVYMSHNSLYVTGNSYEYNDITNEDSKKRVSQDYNTDSDNKDNSNENEDIKIRKREKKSLQEMFPDYEIDKISKKRRCKDSNMTRVSTVYKLEIKAGMIETICNGKTLGWVENNLCMDEKDGYLRMFTNNESDYVTVCYEDYYYDGKRIAGNNYISTHIWYEPDDEGNMYEPKEENIISVFNSDMKRVAMLDGIAEDEDIYASRFIGDYGYLVTFRNTDPLFTIDFTDNENPKVIGKLKMPGYSDNLFSFGKGLLFGIGEESDRVKLDMYKLDRNVADRVASLKLKPDYMLSDAWDYKSVLIDADKGYVGFSVDSFSDSGYPKNSYLLYKYTVNGFELLNSVRVYSEYENTRGIYIGDYLYVISFNYGILSIKIIYQYS